MRVLVTGGTGFLGSHTVAALAKAGHKVKLLVRSEDRIAPALRPLGVEPVDFAVGDITDAGCVEAALRECEAVVHAAAVFTLDRSRDAEVARVNLNGAKNVLGTAHRLGLDPIIYVSSLSALFPPDGPIITADTAVKNPTNPYAKSKAQCERYARELQAEGAPVVCTYPGSVWGPFDPHRGEGVAVVTKFMKMGFAPSTEEGGLPVVDVRDLADIHTALLQAGLGPRRFTAGGHLLKVGELFGMFSHLTGRRFVQIPTPAWLLRGLGRGVDWLYRLTGVSLLLTYEAMHTMTKMVPCDDTTTERELGVSLRGVEETIRDTLLWMYDEGLLGPKHLGRLVKNGEGLGSSGR